MASGCSHPLAMLFVESPVKKYLLLAPLSFVLVLTWLQWRQPSPTPQAEAPASSSAQTTATPALALSEPSSDSSRQTLAKPRQALPASFRGTEIDGGFTLDAAGNLLPGEDVRQLFDYFLAAMGEDSLPVTLQRLRDYIRDSLDEPARSQALAVLEQYLQYKQQLVELEGNWPQLPDLQAMLQRERAVQALRARLFDPQWHQAFFQNEEGLNHFTLQRMAIQRDSSLSPAQRAAAIDQLRAGLPESVQEGLLPQLHSELRTQTQLLLESGGDSRQLRELRQQLVGAEATARLEALDQQRQEWQSRLEQYLQDKQALLDNQGLSEQARTEAIEQLAAERFSEQERLRLSGAQQLLEEQRRSREQASGS